METLVSILVVFVALEHLGFMYLEMFLWTKDSGRKIFGTTKEEAESSKVLAANQGVYNGLFAAGLLWGLAHPDSTIGLHIQLFILVAIGIAGIYGGLTAKRSILYLQALPAVIAAIMIVMMMQSGLG